MKYNNNNKIYKTRRKKKMKVVESQLIDSLKRNFLNANYQKYFYYYYFMNI